MIKHLIKALTLFSVLTIFTIGTVQAQKSTKRIGNRPRHGSSNATFSIIKGNQIGIKMNIGSKNHHLETLNFGVENFAADPVKFKVNVYEFNGETPGENLVNNDIISSFPKGKNRIDVDLSAANIIAKGKILVSIEFLGNFNGSAPAFSIGILNGGMYRYENGKWEKDSVAGVDFNVMVTKL